MRCKAIKQHCKPYQRLLRGNFTRRYKVTSYAQIFNSIGLFDTGTILTSALADIVIVLVVAREIKSIELSIKRSKEKFS